MPTFNNYATNWYRHRRNQKASYAGKKAKFKASKVINSAIKRFLLVKRAKKRVAVFRRQSRFGLNYKNYKGSLRVR